jgi:hypothetical protein
MSISSGKWDGFSCWTRITRCQAGCVIRAQMGRLVAVRSPRNEAGERLAG